MGVRRMTGSVFPVTGTQAASLPWDDRRESGKSARRGLEGGFSGDFSRARAASLALGDRPAVVQTIRKALFSQLFGADKGAEIMARGYIRTDDLTRSYQENFAVFSAQVGRIFREESIADQPPATLMAGGNGQVRVVGDHPDRERIEELFAQDSWLRSRFVSLSALGSQIRAAEEGTAFAAAYEDNQATAIDRYSHLFTNVAPDYLYVAATPPQAGFRWADGQQTGWQPTT